MIRRFRHALSREWLPQLAQNLILAVLTAITGAILVFFAEVPIQIESNKNQGESNEQWIKVILADIEKIKEEIKNYRHNHSN